MARQANLDEEKVKDAVIIFPRMIERHVPSAFQIRGLGAKAVFERNIKEGYSVAPTFEGVQDIWIPTKDSRNSWCGNNLNKTWVCIGFHTLFVGAPHEKLAYVDGHGIRVEVQKKGVGAFAGTLYERESLGSPYFPLAKMSFNMKSTIILLLFAIFPIWVQGNALPSAKRALCPPTPKSFSNFSDAVLPSPFNFANGLPVRSKDDWTCRRNEISQLLQTYELGVKPPKPSSMTSTFTNNNNLTITVSHGGKTISFSSTVTLPTSGNAPFPVFIGLDGGSIPIPDGVAHINLNTNDIALQTDASSRGIGKFFDLYGSDASAGAMIAWAWAASRIIDALETNPQMQINTRKIAVTGCSRDGKGALVAGAFDDRIALTIPQESGSGGTDCWRLSDSLFAGGLVTQTASEIVQENVWFSTAFDPFANTTVTKLPFDHHLLLGMVAPRGLFAIDNIGYDWLGAESSFGCLKSAHTIWEALGESQNMGFSQAANHTHCQFPTSQQSELTAFINKFLFDKPAHTSFADNAGNYTFTTPGSWDPWSTPKLH
ncbi:hypothetical protein C8Q75DRAFT_868682 [Abortiporus biennis]|nr:hypothetical protein C8Q75DRAFT_868682 [Abortiporus biennis]